MPAIISNDEGKGKKYALWKAISHAESEYVWLRDDDVFHTAEEKVQTAEYLSSHTLNADMYILPLSMSAGDGNLLCQLQQTEYAAIQSLTMLTAELHHPVMCAGANLIVRRSCWLDCYQDLHLDLPSGDDMFLLESFKRRSFTVSVLSSPFIAHISPEPTLRALLRQRMRWAGKAAHYTDKDIVLCGIVVAISNILAVSVPPFFILKFAFDWYLISRGKRYGIQSKHTGRRAFLLSLIYPWYMLICIVGGFFNPQRW